MFENCRKTLPALFVSGFVAAAGSVGVATAQDSSPYLIGHWKLNKVQAETRAPVVEHVSSSTEPTGR